MNTSKWIVTFAGVALVAGVALAGAPHNHETASNDGHQKMGMACGMAKTGAEPMMSCCHKAAAETSVCPMHAKSKAAAPSCHGEHAAEAPAADAPAHAGHH